MVVGNYEPIRQRLLESGDSEIAKIVRIFDAVFRSPRYAPLPSSWDAQQQMASIVDADFPTPFARKFLNWADLDQELSETLEELETVADPARRDRLEQRARLRFRNALLEIETCWRQIVHFMPFILMAALRRLRDEVLQQHVAQELAQALHYYNTFYGRYETERQREADQLHLLVYLIRVFRKLRRSVGLDDTVLFARDVGTADLFPERFDAAMRLLQQMRNRVVHGRVADRIGESSLADVAGLVKWCFLDVVAVLEPICRAYSLNYIIDLAGQDDGLEGEALEFVGANGPQMVRYRVSPEPQIELLALLRNRLYFVRRGKRIGGGSGAVLEPDDYLDLAPFIISDTLRRGRPIESAAERQMLFALQQYLEPVSRLLFSDLGGSGDNERPGQGEDPEANSLLEQVRWFKGRIGRLTAQIRLKLGAPIDLTSLHALLWRISRDQLGLLLDVSLYDDLGALLPDSNRRGPRTAYDHELFVEPQESEQVAAFLVSDKRGMLLVGGSGSGKSNLLIHHYLRAVQARQLSVFLVARRFATKSFETVLFETVAREMSQDWTSLDDLADYLEEQGGSLLVVIDAANEYTGPGGPLALLADLIGAVSRHKALRRCKVLATCRAETWARFRQESGERPLGADAFMQNDGDAIRVAGFADPARGRKLFESYRQFYQLDCRNFERFSDKQRALFAQPFMMAIIAETYSNRGRSAEAAPRITVPSDLDYFSIFRQLTDRKGGDAQALVSANEQLRRTTLPTDIKAFCSRVAAIIYEQLTTAGALASGLDSVPLDVIDKRADLQIFVQRRGGISVLEAALQVGLLEQVRTEQRDADGSLVDNVAVTFFHDQYTQYSLASAYQQGVIGTLAPVRLAQAIEVERIAGRISEIVQRGSSAPILVGALDHWLQMNLVNFHDGKLGPVVPLLDRLAEDASAAVRFEVGALLSTLMLRGFLAPRDVFGPVFAAGSQALRLELVNIFVEFWPALPPHAVQALIDACDPDSDGASLDKLGDIFVLHLLQAPELVVDYLDQAIRPLSVARVVELPRLHRQAVFLGQFGIFGFILSFDQPDRLGVLQKFFRAKYRLGIEMLTGSAGTIELAYRFVRYWLLRWLDHFGAKQWQRFIGFHPEAANERFFESVDGVVQQALLRELLPYLVDLHNGDLSRLSLEPESPFRDLVVRMLDFRIMSVIGYNALLCLPAVLLQTPWPVTEALVMELIERRTRASLFFGNLLLANLAYSDQALAGPCLQLMRDRIAPLLLAGEPAKCDWSISFCIATLDVATLWPLQSAILDQLFAAMEASGDPSDCPAVDEMLFKLCYTHDIALGRLALEKLLADGERFLAPRWRPFTLRVMAAMLTRSPPTLLTALRGAGLPDSLVAEVRSSRTAEIVEQARLFPLQADINRFTAWLYLKEPRLRYVVVKHLIGSLACGRSVGDFAVGVRHLFVGIMSLYLGSAPEKLPSGPLTVPGIEEAIATLARERNKRWIWRS